MGDTEFNWKLRGANFDDWGSKLFWNVGQYQTTQRRIP
jgi:hypothetical protein